VLSAARSSLISTIGAALEKALTHANDWIVLTTLIRSDKQQEYIDPRIDTDTFGSVNTLPYRFCHFQNSRRRVATSKMFRPADADTWIPSYHLILFEIESLKELVFR
jgi:hypothetical protein